MTKITPLDLIRSISCGMNDSDFVAIAEFCIGAIENPENIFKIEVMAKAAADLERTSQ